MGKKSDKSNKKVKSTQTPALAPVNTGIDLRAENRSSSRERKNRTDAPDGVSGNWS